MSGLSDTILQVGQESWVRVRNVTGVALSNGKAVYITGRVGDRPTVALAKADSASTSVVLGIVTQTIAHNSDGFVTIAGLVRSVNTAGYPANDTLYLSAATAGEVTNVVPANNQVQTASTFLRNRIGFLYGNYDKGSYPSSPASDGADYVYYDLPTSTNDYQYFIVSNDNGTINISSLPANTPL